MGEAEWKVRVREEKAELCDKLAKLRAFKLTAEFAALPSEDRNLLNDQEGAMQQYADVLGWRIARF